MRRILAAVLFAMLGRAEETDISDLLESYRIASDLSKITVKEAAGVVEVFTRDMLEKMQAHTLADVLKTLSVLNYSRTSRNIPLFTKSSVGFFPVSTVRLYIDDHDLTSSSFGSALLLWGDMPIEQIDHIEVYKGASSNEFGNETGSIIIRLYTKVPEREEGGKVRLMADNHGSYEGHFYYAGQFGNGWKGLIYAENDDIARRKFHYANTLIQSDKRGYLLQGMAAKGGVRIDFGRYEKRGDPFLGASVPYRPLEGSQSGYHTYAHISYKLACGIKLTGAYDRLDYRRNEQKALPDSLVLPYPVTKRFRSNIDDTIYTLQAEKGLDVGRWHLFGGLFYKYKGFHNQTIVRYNASLSPLYDDYSGGLNIYSLYTEGQYALSANDVATLSIKGDRLDYTRDVTDYTGWIVRGGFIHKSGPWFGKIFLTRGYLSLPMYQLFDGKNHLIGGNPGLDPIKVRLLATADLSWQKGANTWTCQVAYSDNSDRVIYHPAKGFVNQPGSSRYRRVTLSYTRRWRPGDFTKISWYGGARTPAVHLSPDYGVMVESFNRFGAFELYNGLHLYGPYRYFERSLDAGWDYTVAVKYHLTPDLSVGIRCENLLNDGYIQAYKDIDGVAAFPVYDQKFWLNVEYLF